LGKGAAPLHHHTFQIMPPQTTRKDINEKGGNKMKRPGNASLIIISNYPEMSNFSTLHGKPLRKQRGDNI
jgi:hypothetical protein